MTRRGFTLVELLVAAVVGAMVAGATVMSMSQLLGLRSRATGRQQAYGRAEAAAASIALDLANVVRDHEPAFVKVAVLDGGDGAEQFDELLVLAHSSRRARPGEESPEGGEYEVQYRVGPLGSDPRVPALWRRIDPALDLALDGGGVASAVVGGIRSLQVEASDGEQWFSTWDSDRDGLPHAVRVTLLGVSDDGRVTAAARRLVAIDRVPVPIAEAAEPTEEPASRPSAAGAAAAGGTEAPSATPSPAPTPPPPGPTGGGRR